jgi:hypothetical protein
VLFGGFASSSLSVLLDETWLWNGRRWQQASPVVRPQARYAHAMTFDATRQRVVLYGGRGSVMLSDTWEWDGAAWRESFPANNPGARAEHAMTYDPVRGRTALTGGTHAFLAGGAWLQFPLPLDVWEFDGVSWTVLSRPLAPVRSNHAIASSCRAAAAPTSRRVRRRWPTRPCSPAPI